MVEVIEVDEYNALQFASMSERTFGLQVERTAKERGWVYYHTFKSQHSAGGFPDYVFVRGGDLFYAELKTESGELTAKQIQWRDVLVGAGQEWHCWRPHMIALIEERFDRPAMASVRGEHQCDALCCCKRTMARKRSTSRSTTPRRKRSSRGSTASPK